MKKILITSLTAATVSLAFVSVSLAGTPDQPGLVEMASFLPAAKREFVEVNLPTSLIKFAARVAKTQEPEVAELLGNIKSIRVNVVGLDDNNRADALGKIDGVRRQLEAQGWVKAVTVREHSGGDNVDVHVKQQNDDTIQGLVVTLISRKGDAVFVNIVGNISADRIGELAEKFKIEPLRKLKLPVGKS